MSSKSIIRLRREQEAVCPVCKSPDYTYLGRANCDSGNDIEYWSKNGKHEFECNSCGNYWQYGNTESKYTRLAIIK